MIATGVRAFGINRAASSAVVEEDTIAVGAPGQSECGRPRMKMFNHLLFDEPSGNEFRILLQGKFLDHPHAD